MICYLSICRQIPLGYNPRKSLLEKDLAAHKSGIEVKRTVMEIDEITEVTFRNIYQQYEIQIEMVDALLEIYEKKNDNDTIS